MPPVATDKFDKTGKFSPKLGRYGGHGNPAFADARDAPDDDGLAARAGSAALGLFGAAKDAVSSYVEGPSGGFAGGRSYSSY